MKIFAVIDSFGIGGAETQLAQTLNYLTTRRGHRCVACSVERPRAHEVAFLPEVGRIYLGKTSPLSAAAALVHLTREIRRFSPDVVYSRLPLANGLARVATWLLRGIPHVAGIDTVPEGFSSAFGYGSVGNRIYRKVELLADRIICNSHATLASALRTGTLSHKAQLIPNAIDVNRFRPTPNRRHGDALMLICVAALRPEKGVPRLVEIMARLAATERVKLVIVGDGVERPIVERLVAEHRLDTTIALLGMRADVPDLLRQADIFLSTASIEGFGIAIAEAAATGLPVVAFDAKGGLRDLVLPDRTGIIVPLDREDKFIESVVRLSHDPAERQRLGAAGREHVRRYCSLEATMEHLERALVHWN